MKVNRHRLWTWVSYLFLGSLGQVVTTLWQLCHSVLSGIFNMAFETGQHCTSKQLPSSLRDCLGGGPSSLTSSEEPSYMKVQMTLSDKCMSDSLRQYPPLSPHILLVPASGAETTSKKRILLLMTLPLCVSLSFGRYFLACKNRGTPRSLPNKEKCINV